MSILAHATYAAPGFEAEKRDLDLRIRHETHEARRIQRHFNCTWTEALHIASQLIAEDQHVLALAEYHHPY